MNKKQQEEYEEMVEELNKIQKAVSLVWRQNQKRLVDEWLKEDLK